MSDEEGFRLDNEHAGEGARRAGKSIVEELVAELLRGLGAPTDAVTVEWIDPHEQPPRPGIYTCRLRRARSVQDVEIRQADLEDFPADRGEIRARIGARLRTKVKALLGETDRPIGF